MSHSTWECESLHARKEVTGINSTLQLQMTEKVFSQTEKFKREDAVPQRGKRNKHKRLPGVLRNQARVLEHGMFPPALLPRSNSVYRRWWAVYPRVPGFFWHLWASNLGNFPWKLRIPQWMLDPWFMFDYQSHECLGYSNWSLNIGYTVQKGRTVPKKSRFPEASWHFKWKLMEWIGQWRDWCEPWSRLYCQENGSELDCWQLEHSNTCFLSLRLCSSKMLSGPTLKFGYHIFCLVCTCRNVSPVLMFVWQEGLWSR